MSTVLQNITLTALWLLYLLLPTASRLEQPCYYYNKTLPTPLYDHSLAFFEKLNKVFIFGGHIATNTPTSSIFKWNINNNEWFTQIPATTPTPEFNTICNNVVTVNHTAYFIGIGNGSVSGVLSGKIYVFDAIQESFIDSNDLKRQPFPAAHGCLTTNNTHIFLVGGKNGKYSYSDYFQIYDIHNNVWHFEQIGQANCCQYCWMINNVLFVFGGYPDWYSMYKYEHGQGWTDLGSKRDSYSGAIAYYNSLIYMIGGISHNGHRNTIDVFDINSKTISNTYYLLSTIIYTTSIIVNDKLFVFGGGLDCADTLCNVAQLTSSVQVCNIATSTSQPTNDYYCQKLRLDVLINSNYSDQLNSLIVNNVSTITNIIKDAIVYEVIVELINTNITSSTLINIAHNITNCDYNNNILKYVNSTYFHENITHKIAETYNILVETLRIHISITETQTFLP
eukprot:159923_1